MTKTHFTKTETLRRFRVAKALMRAADRNVGKSSRVEVGHRLMEVHADTVEGAQAQWSANDASHEDDLDDLSYGFDEAARTVVAQEHGYFAHIYVYEGSSFDSYLYDTQTVWLGTPDQEPVLVKNGRTFFTTKVLA